MKSDFSYATPEFSSPPYQFRYADKMDLTLLFIGVVTALGSGIGMPLMVILFGDLLNTFVADSGTADQVWIDKFKEKHPDCFDGNGT